MAPIISDSAIDYLFGASRCGDSARSIVARVSDAWRRAPFWQFVVATAVGCIPYLTVKEAAILALGTLLTPRALQVLVVAGSSLKNLSEVSSGSAASGTQFYVFVIIGIIVTVRVLPSARSFARPPARRLGL